MNGAILVIRYARGPERRGAPEGYSASRQRRAALRIPNSVGPQGARSLSLTRTLIQLRQKSLSCCAKVFHSLSLSAACRGLVAVSDGHRDSKRKQPCPTADGSDPTRNEAFVK